MILRNLVVRHGRSAASTCSRCLQRTYATEIDLDSPAFKQSERNHKPVSAMTGHPDEPSSILDSTETFQTPIARDVAARIKEVHESMQNLQTDVNALAAGKNAGTIPVKSVSSSPPSSMTKAPYGNLKEMYGSRKRARVLEGKGSVISEVYRPWTIIEKPPTPASLTLPMLLANQTHLGHATALWNPANSSYIFGIRDGIHIISLDITLAYLRRAAKVVEEVARRGGIILFIGTRKGQQQIVVKAAKLANAYHIFDRWTPGTLTNGQQILGDCAVKIVTASDKEIPKYRESLKASAHAVLRPDLVVCMNPLENEVCLHECGLYNVPTIGVIDTDVNPSWVTYPIPANDDSLRSIALIAGVLGRAGQEGQRLRMEAASEGKTTYDTAAVKRFIKGMDEIASMEVRESSSEESTR